MADEAIIRRIPEMTIKEWRAEACARFGSPKRAQFVCPRCGNIASVMDFADFKDQGCRPDHAATTCIGRWSDRVDCDWAAFGLFGTLNGGIRVIHPDGKSQLVFDFAPPSLAAQVAALSCPTEAIEEMSEDDQIVATAKEIEANMAYLGMDDVIIDLADRVGSVEKSYREWRAYAIRLRDAIGRAVTADRMTSREDTVFVEVMQSPDWKPPSSVVPDQTAAAMRDAASTTEGGEGEAGPGDSPSES